MYFDEANEVIIAADDAVLAWISGVLALAVSPLGYFVIPALTAITTQAAKSLF